MNNTAKAGLFEMIIKSEDPRVHNNEACGEYFLCSPHALTEAARC